MDGASERVRAGLQLGGVLGVKTRRLDRADKEARVQLLTVTFEEGEVPGGVILFAFAEDADLAATVECIDAALADISEPWKAE